MPWPIGYRVAGIVFAVVSVIVVAAASSRAFTSGPDWGLQLRLADGEVIASEVSPNSLAWNLDIRPGQVVVQINGQSPRAYVGSTLKSASLIVVRDAGGTQQVATVPDLPDGLGVALVVGALFFLGLGAVVFRWADDTRLGLTFLVFGWAAAMTFVSIPAATLGHQIGFLVAAPSAIVASSCFVLLFLAFPRPVKGANWISLLVTGVTIACVGAIVFPVAAGIPVPRVVDTILWLWVASVLVGALCVLGLRMRNRDDRRRLAPIIVGAAVGILPLVVLNALPYVINQQMIVPIELTPLVLIGIPLGFTYAILRHRLFALDALVRYFLLRLGDIVTFIVIGLLTWSVLQRVDVDDTVAVVIAIALTALIGPSLAARVEMAIDRSLYSTVALARNSPAFHEKRTTQDLGLELARQIRQLVPVQWSAVVARRLVTENPSNDKDIQPTLLIAVDGDAPIHRLRGRWIGSRLVWLDGSQDRTVIPLQSGSRTLGAIVVGPRLNNAKPNALDLETIQILAAHASMPFEAALLRQQAEAERRFREGLSGFARELAAAGSVEQVLHITAVHVRRLLRADVARIWTRDATGNLTEAACDGDGTLGGAATFERWPWDDRATTGAESADAATVIREQTVTDQDQEPCSRVFFRLGDIGNATAIGVAIRRGTDDPFTSEDERRASEMIEHADGAFRRAHALVQATEAETLREIARVRSEFLDIVSHELQNPLSVILGFAELIEMRLGGTDDPMLSKAIASIIGATTTCRRLIDDLLTSSRVDRGRLSLRHEVVDVGKFLARVAQTYQVLPDGHRIRVERTPEDLRVSADVARLEQMVGNLLTNALRYSDGGPVTLRARLFSTDEVSIEVRDFGRGISPEDQARIWDRFYRTAHAESRTPRGVGVGLWIVRTLAELHGGRAEVESKPGEGSLFRIILPLVRPEPSAETQAEKSEGKGPTVAA